MDQFDAQIILRLFAGFAAVLLFGLFLIRLNTSQVASPTIDKTKNPSEVEESVSRQLRNQKLKKLTQQKLELEDRISTFQKAEDTCFQKWKASQECYWSGRMLSAEQFQKEHQNLKDMLLELQKKIDALREMNK